MADSNRLYIHNYSTFPRVRFVSFIFFVHKNVDPNTLDLVNSCSLADSFYVHSV